MRTEKLFLRQMAAKCNACGLQFTKPIWDSGESYGMDLMFTEDGRDSMIVFWADPSASEAMEILNICNLFLDDDLYRVSSTGHIRN